MPPHAPTRRRAGRSFLVVLDVLLLLMVLGAAAQTQAARTLQSLGPVARDMHAFWDQRMSELCGGERAAPTLPPLGTSPAAHLALLARLTPIAAEVWRLHESCQEPRTIVISEDLLHFRVNRHDEFEADPRPAFDRIAECVDQNVGGRSQIYIFGHTDDTYTTEYNDLLSYRRALEIAAVVRRHLDSRGLDPGAGYALYPVGMGESQLLPRNPGENLASWRTRCRRIELSFRSPRRGDAETGR